jgi:hypothetical protein
VPGAVGLSVADHGAPVGRRGVEELLNIIANEKRVPELPVPAC